MPKGITKHRKIKPKAQMAMPKNKRMFGKERLDSLNKNKKYY